MIDLTNKPEGATGYREGYFYKMVDGNWLVYIGGLWKGSQLWDSDKDEIELIRAEWTIHNNTLPLSELSDEQAAELFNYIRRGGDVEMLSGGGTWLLVVNGYYLSITAIYRAKQKTDRELFIEAAKATGGGLSPTELELVHAMFNVGFKAPKVGE